MIGFFRSLVAAVRRFFSRRAAQKLLAEQLPKGLLPAPFRLALRVPVALDDAPEGEFWTLPLGAQTIRGQRPSKLFRLSCLPLPRKPLSQFRPPELRDFRTKILLPKRLEIPPPIDSRVVDLGAARPKSLRLDADLRLPTEIDPLRIAPDAKPPARERRVRPRTPIARAPVTRLKQTNFRIDPRTGMPANEGIVPPLRDPTGVWINQRMKREKVDLPWMAGERIMFLFPMQEEWFVMWWDEYQQRKIGGKEPYEYELAAELTWALDECKEQMLIRRDVKKDEMPPEEQEFFTIEVGPPMEALKLSAKVLDGLIPEKEWIERAQMLDSPLVEPMAREAYLQWRTLVDALEER